VRKVEEGIKKGRVISCVYVWVSLFVKLPNNATGMCLRNPHLKMSSHVCSFFLPSAEIFLQTYSVPRKSIPKSKGRDMQLQYVLIERSIQ
jgi:hypothetical protein